MSQNHHPGLDPHPGPYQGIARPPRTPTAPVLDTYPPPIPPRLTKSTSADVSTLSRNSFSYPVSHPQGQTGGIHAMPQPSLLTTGTENMDRDVRGQPLMAMPSAHNTSPPVVAMVFSADLEGIDFHLPAKSSALKDIKAKGLSSSEDNISHYNHPNVYPDIRAAFHEVLPTSPAHMLFVPVQNLPGNQTVNGQNTQVYGTGSLPPPPAGFIYPVNGGDSGLGHHSRLNRPSMGLYDNSLGMSYPSTGTVYPQVPNSQFPSSQSMYDSLSIQSSKNQHPPMSYPTQDAASVGFNSVSSGYTIPRLGSWNDFAEAGRAYPPQNTENNIYADTIFKFGTQPPGVSDKPGGDLIALGRWLYNEEPEYLSLESFDPLYQKSTEGGGADISGGLAQGGYELANHFGSVHETCATSETKMDPEEMLVLKTYTIPEEVSESDVVGPSGVYQDVDDLLDPFSLTFLENKRNKSSALAESEPGQTIEGSNENVYETLKEAETGSKVKQRPPRPPRPMSRRISKKASGMYELLKPMSFLDEESRSFCAMVTDLKSRFLSTDEQCNPGFVVGCLQGHLPHEKMTVKVVIYATFVPEPIPFTCDIDLLVEHVISQVLYSRFDETGCLTAADYLLKVYDRSEYLLNIYPLSWYKYVQHCLKIDCDIKFSLIKKDQIPLPLLRTFDDDAEPVFFPRDFIQKDPGEVSRESLEILMETFYREVERLRDHTVTGSAEVSHCHSLCQSVKAVCAILAHIETMPITKAINRVENVVSQLPYTACESPELEYKGDIYNDPGSTQYIDLEARCCLIEDLQEALDELIISVQELVNLYCQTFHTDFILYAGDDKYKEDTEVTGILDNFIMQVASAHRIPASWLILYEGYCVQCSLHHSGQSLGKAVTTKSMVVSKFGLCERIIFDEWIQFEDTLLCSLPRESRLCLTLYGMKNVPNANASISNTNTGQVKTALGGATVQLFDHKSQLVNGPQLVILRPGKEADPLASSKVSLLPESVLLQVNLPEFGKHVVFPEAIESDVKVNKAFDSLSIDIQEELKKLLQKDCITELSADEKELLWDRKHFLLEMPAALPKVLQSAHGWDWACLADIYVLLRQWDTPSPLDALQLLMPQFADHRVREFAVTCLRNLYIDEMLDYLPQLVQALKFESYHTSHLAELLLERACNSIRFAHDLFWLLKEAAQDSVYRRRYQLMFGAVMSVAGDALRKEFRKQEELMRILGTTAEKVKAGRDKEMVLRRQLETVYELFEKKQGVLLPLNINMDVVGIDLKSCSYFASNAFPLKLVFRNNNFYAEPIYTMFKVGDDLRQDMLTLQLIHIMDNLWLKEGLDLKMITFSVLSTGPNRGMIELVTESETLRKIQASQGLTGSFKDRPIKEWLQKHNITELDYQKAVDNFLRSCAGYCVATYVLGICDRHNDNIMLKQSGHMFHIDFGKFLGDSQMFGSFKRDRVPFVLTSDMAYVINDGERQSSKFQQFVDFCCQAFSILRKNANLFLSLFTLMSKSGIPGVSETAATYVQTALLPNYSNAEATEFFTRMIDESLKSVFTQFNFFIHNLAQLKFSSHNEGALLSFVPKTYSINIDGKIQSIEVVRCQKRYVPEKHYVYIIKVEREAHRVPSFIFRRFSEFVEFREKLRAQFPLTNWHPLPTRLILGRSHVKPVAESRKGEIEKFLKELLIKAPEISGSDLVYTFFHPLLRDEQDIAETTIAPTTGEVSPGVDGHCVVKGQVKVSLQYKKDALAVMIMHAKDLGSGPVVPSPYVKTYLLPDPFKETKRKTKVVKNTNHPVYNEILQYKISRNEVRNKILQVTIWDHDLLKENEFMGAVFIKLRELDLSQEIIKWYPLGNLQVSISEMLA